MSNTFTLLGRCAPIFLSVSGLTERELPKSANPNGLLLFEVQGLLMANSVKICNTQPGYVLLMRSEKGIDVSRYRIYRDSVFLPFVDSIRKEYDQWDGNMNNLQPNMFVVSWQDGDIPEISNIAQDAETYHRHQVIANRHNPARTVVEQAADLAKAFPCLHRNYRKNRTLVYYWFYSNV